MTSEIQASYGDLVDVMAKNPASRRLVFAALNGARERIERSVLAAQLAQLPRVKTCTQTPQTVLSLMIKYGALEEAILIDGMPYGGTSDDLKEDEDLDECSTVSYFLETTDNGLRLLEEQGAGKSLSCLLSDRPRHAETFMEVLRFCDTEEGRTMKQVESYLKDGIRACEPDPRTGFPAVYPAYYTTALEESGALVWDGVWRLTGEGKEYASLHG